MSDVKRYTLINGLLHYVRKVDEHTLFSGEKEVVLASDHDAAIADLEKEIDRLCEFEWMYKDLCK